MFPAVAVKVYSSTSPITSSLAVFSSPSVIAWASRLGGLNPFQSQNVGSRVSVVVVLDVDRVSAGHGQRERLRGTGVDLAADQVSRRSLQPWPQAENR